MRHASSVQWCATVRGSYRTTRWPAGSPNRRRNYEAHRIEPGPDSVLRCSGLLLGSVVRGLSRRGVLYGSLGPPRSHARGAAQESLGRRRVIRSPYAGITGRRGPIVLCWAGGGRLLSAARYVTSTSSPARFLCVLGNAPTIYLPARYPCPSRFVR